MCIIVDTLFLPRQEGKKQIHHSIEYVLREVPPYKFPLIANNRKCPKAAVCGDRLQVVWKEKKIQREAKQTKNTRKEIPVR